MCEDRTQTSLNNISVLVSVYVYLFFGAYVKKNVHMWVCLYIRFSLFTSYMFRYNYRPQQKSRKKKTYSHVKSVKDARIRPIPA